MHIEIDLPLLNCKIIAGPLYSARLNFRAHLFHISQNIIREVGLILSNVDFGKDSSPDLNSSLLISVGVEFNLN
jgi:hypothetical protein